MIQPVQTDQADAPTGTPTSAARMGGRRRPSAELWAAAALLTRLPVPANERTGPGVRACAIVGALLGLVTFVPLVALGTAIPVAAAILALAAMAILSGGLHLDGLADTFDALVAVGPDAAERARRDPAVGVGGATAIALVLGLDVAALADLLVNRGAPFAVLACVAAGSVSRLVPAVLARIARSSAVEDGLGAWFVRRTGGRDVAAATLGCLGVLLIAAFAAGGMELAIGGALGGAGAIGAGLLLVRLRRQVDGDLLGASVEIAFALTLLTTAVLAARLGA